MGAPGRRAQCCYVLSAAVFVYSAVGMCSAVAAQHASVCCAMSLLRDVRHGMDALVPRPVHMWSKWHASKTRPQACDGQCLLCGVTIKSRVVSRPRCAWTPAAAEQCDSNRQHWSAAYYGRHECSSCFDHWHGAAASRRAHQPVARLLPYQLVAFVSGNTFTLHYIIGNTFTIP